MSGWTIISFDWVQHFLYPLEYSSLQNWYISIKWSKESVNLAALFNWCDTKMKQTHILHCRLFHQKSNHLHFSFVCQSIFFLYLLFHFSFERLILEICLDGSNLTKVPLKTEKIHLYQIAIYRGVCLLFNLSQKNFFQIFIFFLAKVFSRIFQYRIHFVIFFMLA